MIIIDDQDGPFNKSADTAASSSVENVRGSERDSMLTAQRLAQQSQHYQYTIPHPEPEPLPPPYSPRNEPESDPLLPYYFQRELSTRADKRFVHALAYAALFWTVFGFLARGVFIFTSKQIQIDPVVNKITYPNETTIRCLEEKDWKYSSKLLSPLSQFTNGENTAQFYSTVTLDFPPEIDSIFLTSHNFVSQGGVAIAAREDDSNRIRVEITSFYLTEDIRDKYKICILSREGNSRGLGIMGLSEDSPILSLDSGFGFGVHFPFTSETRPRRYKSFESDIPRLFYSSDNTLGDIEFEKLSIKTQDNAIMLNSIDADNVDLTTENSLITGIIQSSKSIAMRTTNSYIEAAINLQSKSNDTMTSLVIETDHSNSVSANVRLSTAGNFESVNHGGYFNVNASCPGAHVNLRFLDAPLASVLQVGTVSRSVLINLPPTYEGQWNLVSPVRVITVNPDSTDPTGHGRLRRYEEFKDKSGDVYAGLSWWGDFIPPSAARSYINSESLETAFVHFT